MAKSKGGSGNLFSKSRLWTIGLSIAGGAFVINKLQATASDPTKKGTLMAQAAGLLGFKGPAIS